MAILRLKGILQGGFRMTTTDKYLTLTAVATKLGVSERTIHRRIDNGDIGAEKFHGKLMVVLTPLQTYPNWTRLSTEINHHY